MSQRNQIIKGKIKKKTNKKNPKPTGINSTNP